MDDYDPPEYPARAKKQLGLPLFCHCATHAHDAAGGMPGYPLISAIMPGLKKTKYKIPGEFSFHGVRKPSIRHIAAVFDNIFLSHAGLCHRRYACDSATGG
jgi:hypothetical protein